MTRVLIVERDQDLRKLLRMVLRSERGLSEASDIEEALTTLRESAEPLVVVLGDWPPGASGEHILRASEHDESLRQHAYILVSTNYDGITPAFRDLLARLCVPMLPMPGDLSTLRGAVREAAARVAPPRKRRRGGSRADA